MAKIKVSFFIEEVEVSEEEWEDQDTFNLMDCINQSLDVWGDISDLRVSIEDGDGR